MESMKQLIEEFPEPDDVTFQFLKRSYEAAKPDSEEALRNYCTKVKSKYSIVETQKKQNFI